MHLRAIVGLLVVVFVAFAAIFIAGRDGSGGFSDSTQALPRETRVIAAVQSHERILRDSNAADMLLAIELGGLLTLLLICAVLALSAFFAYRLVTRRSQLAIRRAVGATRADIFRFITLEGLVVISLGVAVGALLALKLSNWLSDRYSLPSLPIAYVASAAFLLWILGLLVTVVWARKAADTPPANISPRAEPDLF